MRAIDGVRVTASLHAAQRAIERLPLMKGADLGGASYWLEGASARALVDRRVALRAPSWCVRDDEEGIQRRAKASKRHGTMRFVWNEEETAAMLVLRQRDRAGSFWLVVTVLSPEPAAV